jgi:hypothetical protein
VFEVGRDRRRRCRLARFEKFAAGAGVKVLVRAVGIDVLDRPPARRVVLVRRDERGRSAGTAR